jgi:hypothetical protein
MIRKEMVIGDNIISFLQRLEIKQTLPHGIKILNPYKEEEVKRVTGLFYRKYYPDHLERRMILGINPGRFGAGVTGISFTDPVRLEKDCNIQNSLAKRPETSSVFIYKMIHAYGGCFSFYRRYYVTAVCPLGFTSGGKNLNYYDRKELSDRLRTFIVHKIREQIDFGLLTDRAFCIGEGKNYHFLQRINQEHHFFKEIVPLPHPRFVMQYRYKDADHYISHYLSLLR